MVSDSSGTGRLAGKVAIVSGGARGIGEATTRALVREGAQVVIGDLLDAEGEALVAELGPSTRYCHLDVRIESDWQRIVAQTTEAFGSVDVLVNNAGVMVVCPLEASTKEMFERTFQVNVLGPFLGTQSVIEPMRRAGGGSVVTVSSVSGHTGTMGLTAYSASKAGNAAITKCAAMELGPDHIRVNAVVPGGIETPMSQGPEFEGIDTSSTYLRLPIPRIGQPEEVAEAVLFLASDASSYMTGTELIIDGGMLAGPLLH
jgi:3alpha(or 20beta)-hydroxysteroid dehydrogenase